jgi:hypothetical protein
LAVGTALAGGYIAKRFYDKNKEQINDAFNGIGGNEQGAGVYEAKSSKKSSKERSSDIPSWSRGKSALPGENGNDYATKLLNEKYGKGNWKKGPNTEHNKLRKNKDRR